MLENVKTILIWGEKKRKYSVHNLDEKQMGKPKQKTSKTGFSTCDLIVNTLPFSHGHCCRVRFVPRCCLVLQTIATAYAKRISGATLISLVNSDRLGELGITRLKRTQLLWNLEVRILLQAKRVCSFVFSRLLPTAGGDECYHTVKRHTFFFCFCLLRVTT